MATYRPLGALVQLLDLAVREPVNRLFVTYGALFAEAPGSRQSHQAWPGGYVGHVEEVCNIGISLWMALGSTGRPMEFTLSDFLLVLMLHDLEKPFMYQPGDERITLETKAARAQFRLAKLREVGLTLTAAQSNALAYVEGEGDDYRAGERVMGPLAAFCHMCDVASARLWPDYPAAADDPWAGLDVRLAQSDPRRGWAVL